MADMNRGWEVILVGAGLANSLIALRLRQCHPELRILMLEAGLQPGGNHSWSFHQGDITAEQHSWLKPLVTHRWQGYQVRFPAFTRSLAGSYSTISSERLARVLTTVLGEALWTETVVCQLTPRSVTLADGRRLTAGIVIDGRGWQPAAPFHTGFQAFLGQQWRLGEPHGITHPVLMDATVAQNNGYRFVYTLPLSENTLLIEDTHYIDGTTFSLEQARENIARYATANHWQLMAMEREEQGCLPITLGGSHHRFWQQKEGQPCSGLRAGLFHATTGYSLPQAVALADLVATQSVWDADLFYQLIYRYACQQWRQQRFFRMLNRLLFRAGPANQRWQILQRFYQLDDGLIARFYAGDLRLSYKVRILMGNPPVPPVEAIKAIFSPGLLKRIP